MRKSRPPGFSLLLLWPKRKSTFRTTTTCPSPTTRAANMYQPKSLVQVCQRIIANYLDGVTSVGVAPYFLLEPALRRATAVQLEKIEEYNEQLIEDTDDLWHQHCLQDFHEIREANATNTLGEVPSWRALYMCTREDREAQKRESAARLRNKFRKLNDEKRTRATKLLTDDVANRVLKRTSTGGSGWWGGDSSKRSKAQTIIQKARMQAKQATQNFTPVPPTHRLSTTTKLPTPISVPTYSRVAMPILASPTSSGYYGQRKMNVGAVPVATEPHNPHTAVRRPGRQEMSPPKTPQGSPTSPGSSSAWSDDEHVHRFFAELSPPAPTSPPGRSRGGEDKPRLTMDYVRKRSTSTRSTASQSVETKRPKPSVSMSDSTAMKKLVKAPDPAIEDFFKMLNG